MTILKAFLLTLLLILVYNSIHLGLIYPIALVIKDVEFLSIWMAMINIISFLLSYFIIFRFFWKEKIKFNELLDLRKIDDNIFFYLVLIAAGLHLFNKPFWNINDILDFFNNKELNTTEEIPENLNLHFVLRSISILIIAPVFEELYFRKFLFTKLLQRYSLTITIIVSSFLFSLIHIESLRNLMPTFIFGVISGLVFFKTKRIAYPVLLHFLYNLIIQLLRISSFPLDAFLDGLKLNFFYWAVVLSGGLLVSFGLFKIFKLKMND